MSTDIHGNVTLRQVFVDPSTATQTQVTDVPNSDTDSVSASRCGLPVSATSATGLR